MIDDDELDIVVDDDESPEPLEFEEPESKEEEKPEEDDKEAYGRRVQKRIDKMVWKHSQELEKRDREQAELRRELEELRKAHQEIAEERSRQSFDSRRSELLTRRKEAFEINDLDEVNDIDDELMDIKIKSRKQEPPATQARQPGHPQEYPPANYNEALANWQNRNQWVFDQSQAKRLGNANKLLEKLLSEGFDMEEPETYTELDKRLKREIPPPTGAPDRGSPSRSDKSFTEDDKRQMLKWGLNPNDAAQRKDWIKNRG